MNETGVVHARLGGIIGTHVFLIFFNMKVCCVFSLELELPDEVICGRQKSFTIELQWVEHLWNHENMNETGVVQVNEC